MPGKIQEVLDEIEPVYELARVMAKEEEAVFFLGRHVGYPVALEGALKLKEIAYMHAEGFAAGELKHGPIAVIEEDTPVFVVVPPRMSGRSPTPSSVCRRARPCCSPWWQRSRCRPSPVSWPPPRVTTSTSHAIWPSPSRWSDFCTISPPESGDSGGDVRSASGVSGMTAPGDQPRRS